MNNVCFIGIGANPKIPRVAISTPKHISASMIQNKILLGADFQK